jgi:hypothetical protein
MEPGDVIGLADKLRTHLEHGDLTGLGTLDLESDGLWEDAERAVRIMLADVAHRVEGGRPSIAWCPARAGMSSPSGFAAWIGRSTGISRAASPPRHSSAQVAPRQLEMGQPDRPGDLTLRSCRPREPARSAMC